ncbi:MAG: peptidylprolyl isomerase [Alphaproteobacteria bacterium]|nr:peptidylprolyl isomerase [Alphaproteobacteria bacterium]
MPIKALIFCLPILFAASGAIAQEPAKAPARMPTPAANVPVEAENVLDLDLSNGGRVRIQLRPDIAPNHVERIKALARQGFYNGVIFHRVIEGFMAQTGDPTGTGQGSSEFPDLKAEFNAYPHLRGTVSMARASSEDSANSQFFIMLMPRFTLDRKYTALGRVIGGMEYVDAIVRGEPPTNPTRVLQASVEADGKAPPSQISAAPGVASGKDISVDDLNTPIRQ